MSHHHYIVNGFMHEENDGRLVDLVTIDVFAESESEALTKAGELVAKKQFRVASVVEHDGLLCPSGGH